MQKEWLLPGVLAPEARQAVKDLTEKLKCPPLIAELLYRKDLRTPEEIESFFHPKLEQQNDPFLFQDMEKAVETVIQLVQVWEERASG